MEKLEYSKIEAEKDIIMSIEDFKTDLMNIVGDNFYTNDAGDFVLNDYKSIFEYCEFSIFCENVSGNHRSYHTAKQKKYLDAGYRFFIVFEDEYLCKRSVVLSRINNILGKNYGEKLYARDCVVEEIKTRVSSKFINEFHIQGNSGSKVKLGLFKKDGMSRTDLVSVMTFGGLSRAKGNRNANQNDWELVRFCTDTKYRCIGAAGKLLKHFERNYSWGNMLTFADKRWSPTGNLYTKIGFNLHSTTQPNYYYLKLPNFDKRCHRFAFRRNVLRDRAVNETSLNEAQILSMTEFELAKVLGYDRIWDAGNYKFVKQNQNL